MRELTAVAQWETEFYILESRERCSPTVTLSGRLMRLSLPVLVLSIWIDLDGAKVLLGPPAGGGHGGSADDQLAYRFARCIGRHRSRQCVPPSVAPVEQVPLTTSDEDIHEECGNDCGLRNIALGISLKLQKNGNLSQDHEQKS